jgi:hypothetical protein
MPGCLYQVDAKLYKKHGVLNAAMYRRQWLHKWP